MSGPWTDLSTPPAELERAKENAAIRARNEARLSARAVVSDLFAQIALALEPLELEEGEDD